MHVAPQHCLVLLELAASHVYVCIRYAQTLFEDQTGDEDLVSKGFGGGVEEERQRMHDRGGLEVCDTLLVLGLGIGVGVIAASSVQP